MSACWSILSTHVSPALYNLCADATEFHFRNCNNFDHLIDMHWMAFASMTRKGCWVSGRKRKISHPNISEMAPDSVWCLQMTNRMTVSLSNDPLPTHIRGSEPAEIIVLCWFSSHQSVMSTYLDSWGVAGFESIVSGHLPRWSPAESRLLMTLLTSLTRFFCICMV